MVKFHIAEATSTISVNVSLPDLMRQRPDVFRENMKIESYFGSPAVAWNGGRIILGDLREDRIKQELDAYNSRGIHYRLTFTNPSLTEKDLEDRQSNMILNIADNGMNEVIVNSPLLEQYIRQTHPRMKLTSSTCKCIRDMSALKEELAKDYSLVVLDYNFNNNFEELEKLTPEERKRCEILVNPRCTPNCPRRAEHYKFIGDVQRRVNELRDMNKAELAKEGVTEWECKYRAYDPLEGRTKLQVDADDIYTKYAEMGFENFKIEGRAAHILVLSEYIAEYLSQQGKRDALRYYLLLMALSVNYFNYY